VILALLHPTPPAPGHAMPVRQQARAPVTAPAVPQVSYPSGPLSAAQVAGYVRAAGFPEGLVSTMVAIAARESGFDPRAVNPSSGACGLFQLYPCPGPAALGPAVNAQLAFAKYRAAGDSLSPWG